MVGLRNAIEECSNVGVLLCAGENSCLSFLAGVQGDQSRLLDDLSVLSEQLTYPLPQKDAEQLDEAQQGQSSQGSCDNGSAILEHHNVFTQCSLDIW